MNPNQTDIFRPLFAELDRQLAGELPVRLAIEGGSASGKTTLGQILAERYGCTVFHMDDFFLRPEQRTASRFAEPLTASGFSKRCFCRCGAAKKSFTAGLTALPCSCKSP